MRLQRVAAALLPALLLFLAGCGQQWASNREEIQVAGKAITVLDNPEPISYEKSVINTIVRLEDVRGMDWLSDEEILVDRENREMEPEYIEGADWYPHNIYIHTLSTGAETAVYPSAENQGFAQVSPDRTKIFYKSYYPGSSTAKGYFLDLVSEEAMAFTEEDAMMFNNGRWIDLDSIIYATIEGTIYEKGTDQAKPRKLLESSTMFPNNLAYLDGQIYYTTLKGEFIVHSPAAKPDIERDDVAATKISLDHNVVWMVPSPDKQRLAIVSRISNGEMELLITDLKGAVLRTIAQDSQIYGTAWSPDGSQLAYAGIAPNGTTRGVYIADASTGSTATLPLDIKFIGDPLSWNPSGNRLMVTASLPGDQQKQQSRPRFDTYLVRVGSL